MERIIPTVSEWLTAIPQGMSALYCIVLYCIVLYGKLLTHCCFLFASSSAESKRCLKNSFYLHFLLYLLVVFKLLEDILDRLDIFILELQELRIPKPDLWEWMYGLSFFLTFFALQAMNKNSTKLIYIYMLSSCVFCFGPVLVAETQYAYDFYLFVRYADIDKLTYVWRSIPISVIFQAFAVIALQVHTYQMFYAYRLYRVWKSYSAKKSN